MRCRVLAASIVIVLLWVCSALVLPAGAATADDAEAAARGITGVSLADFGAVGDGTTLNTAAFQKAIEACEKAGGGTVVVPPGKWLTGTIVLKSHVTLYLDSGATILGSQKRDDYPMVDDVWTSGRKTIAPLIYAENAQDISIAGKGTIDGQGRAFWNLMSPNGRWPLPGQTRPSASRPTSRPTGFGRGRGTTRGRGAGFPGTRPFGTSRPATRPEIPRPQLIRLVRCSDVVIEHVHCMNSPMWNIHPLLCERVRIDGVTITADVPSPNTDGINPESCRDVQIINCRIDVGDDCVTLKSGIDEAGRKMGKPDEDITISNCVMYHGHGGVSIGSEMSGGVRNVTVTNCVFHGTDAGIRVKSQRGRGGVVEGLAVSNVVMQDVPTPITITTFYMDRNSKPGDLVPLGEGTPKFTNFTFSNITARGARTAGTILGLRELPISDITFNNIHIDAQTGFVCTNANGVAFLDTVINPQKGSPLGIRDCDNIDASGLRMTAPHSSVPLVEQLSATRPVPAPTPEEATPATEETPQ
jgi:polygalacturonase